MSSVLLYIPSLGHTQQFHPENHRRVEGLLSFFDVNNVLADMRLMDGKPADARLLARVHSRGLLEEVRLASQHGPGRIDADTYVTTQSYELARLAAGSCCVAVDAVCAGHAQNGLVIVRPPGHHAERDKVGGFCLINNVAVAARHAQLAHGVGRVMIVDFDVHHGNGTQDIFYEDPNVLFISLHLFHHFFYPGTGEADEVGSGPGKGFTLNVPFPPGVGDIGYRRALEELIAPRAQGFSPDLILVSTGFDAHWQDPLARASLSLHGYAELCRQLIDLAGDLCDGRVVFILEGGYHIEALRIGLLNLANALVGQDIVHDPLGQSPEPERDVSHLLVRLKKLHLPK